MTAAAVRASAELLADRGELVGADQAARSALERTRRGQACFEAAAALLRLARIQFHAGDAADARALIGQAKDLLGKSQAPGILTGLLDETERLAGPVAPAAAPRSHGRVRRPDGLTAREAEVLGLLAAGNSNDEIAAELVISVHTVVRHLQNAYRKIRVRNRAQAAAYMVLNG
jgi:ATP/maltotriose-dependent transcriptional regulator MalT